MNMKSKKNRKQLQTLSNDALANVVGGGFWDSFLPLYISTAPVPVTLANPCPVSV
jgi:bacteriocin-like protein